MPRHFNELDQQHDPGQPFIPHGSYVLNDYRSPYELDEMSRSGRSGRSRSRRRRFPSNFSYISSWVKYSNFLFNFLFWLLGAVLVAVGLYAIVDKWKTGESFRMDNFYDIIFNLAFLLVLVGGIVFIVSFAGCIGALRENVCFLRFFSFCLILFFLAEMCLVGLGFVFPHKVTNFLEESLSDELIKSYRDDLDFQNLIDLMQQEFKCCGISSEGYRDWSKNEYFNCTRDPKANPSVERCGVPFSCCTANNDGIAGPGLVNIMCGFGVQEMKKTDVIEKIYTQGCLTRVQAFVEQNLYLVAAVALGFAVLQVFVIYLSRTLEQQIESQRSLWNYR